MGDQPDPNDKMNMLKRVQKLVTSEETIQSVQSVDKDMKEVDRGHWDSKIDFLLSCIGFAVGLGNIWRFPFKVLSNGGGSYIIAYLIMLTCMALPIFFIELSIGQFTSQGTTECWHFAPGFKGIGYTMLLMSLFCCIYYNTIIAWAFYYFYSSFYPTLPWLNCNNYWNDYLCVDSNFYGILKTNLTNYEMSTEQFFQRVVITRIVKNPNDGLPIVRLITDNPGGLNWPITICLFIAWALCCGILIYGIKVSGKSMYFFTTFPYFVIVIMIGCGASLEGSGKGLLFYVTPVWDKLLKIQTWQGAAEQIFFSLGIGFGSLLTFGSYNHFRGNILKDVMLIGIINSGTSLLAATAVFEIMGFMAYRYNTTIDHMSKYAGSGLIFIAYPEGLSLFPGQNILLILFFLMILCLGVDSQLGMMECAITGFLDGIPHMRDSPTYRHILVVGLHVGCFLIALLFSTKTGYYWFEIVSKYSVATNLLIVGFLEAILIGFIYGFNNFNRDVKMMIGRDICLFWKICILVPVPIVTIFLTIIAFMYNSTTTIGSGYNKVTLPIWCDVIGYIIFCLTLVPIPIFFILHIIKMIINQKMSFKEAFVSAFKPDIFYGPAKYKYWKSKKVYDDKYQKLLELGYITPKTILHKTSDIDLKRQLHSTSEIIEGKDDSLNISESDKVQNKD